MQTEKYTIDDFDFSLPEDLIAQHPLSDRDRSRLFVLNRATGSYDHKFFFDLPGMLEKGDLLVLNDAKVLSARIFCTRQSGGKVELILIERKSDTIWDAISNRTKRLVPGEIIISEADPDRTFKIIDKSADTITIEANAPLTPEVLDSIGHVPLPPYIRRPDTPDDRDRYQTVFASIPGAAAAPTAGLHFTRDILDRIAAAGVQVSYCTLFVSWGTFMPVRVQDLSRHTMHAERFYLPETTAEALNAARKEGRRIISVGTTVIRVLESTFRDGINIPGHGETDIFIYPPYRIQSINSLITNFHTPKSTLLMLVSAFAGKERIMDAYKTAIGMKYRFFSYGDSMFIL